MIIRDEGPGDREAVFSLVAAAFGQADEAWLVRALQDGADAVIALVAEQDGVVIGHVLLSRLRAPFPALALAPVSVAPGRQRTGVGAALIRAAITRAQAEEWAAIFVLGDPGYYRRFGFDAEAAKGFSTPYAGPDFMALALSPPLPATRGELRHATPFALLG
jgi:putative acetyltransferase